MTLKRTLFQGLARRCTCPCRGRRCTPSPRKMPMLSPRGELQPLRPHAATAAAAVGACTPQPEKRHFEKPLHQSREQLQLRAPKTQRSQKETKNKPFLGFYTRIDLLLDLVHAISLLIHFTHLLTHPSHYNFLSCSLYFCRFMLFKLLFYHLK